MMGRMSRCCRGCWIAVASVAAVAAATATTGGCGCCAAAGPDTSSTGSTSSGGAGEYILTCSTSGSPASPHPHGDDDDDGDNESPTAGTATSHAPLLRDSCEGECRIHGFACSSEEGQPVTFPISTLAKTLASAVIQSFDSLFRIPPKFGGRTTDPGGPAPARVTGRSGHPDEFRRVRAK
eukprot:GHVU01142243.1.p1 GENE.GHVU01142243.1~~GHVU01142243.1.p1  ORF type:complete len:180 (-),score=12.08 GHVU01142243.1:37-576(-)